VTDTSQKRNKPKNDLRTLLLDLQVSVPSQPFGLIPFVSLYDVAPLVKLEIPRRDQNNISLPYPHSPLHLSPNSAETLLAVLAAHQNPIETQHFFGYANDVVNHRQHHILKLFLADDLLFSQSETSRLLLT